MRRCKLEKQLVVAYFPLANDARESQGVWTDIGDNAKCRINDLFCYSQCIYSDGVWVFAAGTDCAHAEGKTLATLGYEYFSREHRLHVGESIVNWNDSSTLSTKEEIIWGMKMLLRYYPKDKFNLRVVFGTQGRHIPRVVKIVEKYCPGGIVYMFVTTGQTKEIPLWREFISWVKLYLGDGWLGQLVQRLRRRFPDRFDRA